MAEMIITTPLEKRTVDDYDVLFESGMVMPITVEPDAGDQIQFGDNIIRVHLAAKPSRNNPEKSLPAEDITLFVRHILSIQHRVREVVEQTPEERNEWQKAFDQLSGASDVTKH